MEWNFLIKAKNRLMNNVFILSSIKIYKGNSAGSSRMMNFSKALALEGVKVYLCSALLKNNIDINRLQEVYPNIFLVGEESKKPIRRIRRKLRNLVNILVTFKYFKKIIKLTKQINGDKVFYIYPTGAISIDLVSLVYIKVMHKYKLFYDVNKLRRSALYNRLFSKNIFKKIYEIVFYITDYIKFWIIEILTKYYDGLVVISTNIENYFKKYNKNLIRIPILSYIIENPFPKIPAYIDGESFKICFTGMISLKKEGFDIFYRALSIVKSGFKNFELHLYGPISKNEKKLLLYDLPLQYGIKKNIVYNGIVEQANIIEEMQKNHLLILPRPLYLQTKYGFSTKLSEYLISGVPVLVTDVSDNSLYIKDGYNGFIVKPGDPKEMAKKIIYIITNYNKLKDSICRNGYNTAKENFNYANYSKKIYNFLFN